MPAKAGIQCLGRFDLAADIQSSSYRRKPVSSEVDSLIQIWMPAFAGMTPMDCVDT
jgi:hypothetical protein